MRTQRLREGLAEGWNRAFPRPAESQSTALSIKVMTAADPFGI